MRRIAGHGLLNTAHFIRAQVLVAYGSQEEVELEAISVHLPKASADVRLRAVNQTHRRELTASEVRRGLAEPIDLSGSRLCI